MKNGIKNCLATTGMSLILLSIIGTLYNARFLYIYSVYQGFAANIIIHLGLTVLKRFESKYFIIEILLEIGYVLIVLIIAGFLFGWYSSTPIWILVLMGITVYFIGSLIDIFRIRNDVKFINQQLKLRKEQSNY